ELRTGAGGADHLAALADLELDVVDHGAERHLAERQRAPDVDRRVLARHHLVADRQVSRPEDVALLAGRVVQQRDARRAVRVVLDRGDLRRHAVLVAAEVDLAVAPLVAAAAEPDRLLALVVPAAALLLALGEGLV